MLGRLLFLIGLIVLPASGAMSQSSGPSGDALRLWDAMQLSTFMGIAQQEAVSAAEQSPDVIQQGRDPAALGRIAAVIYDPERIKGRFLTALDRSLGPDAQNWLPQALTFLDSPLGQNLTTLEMSIRRAFLDEDLEEDAGNAFGAARLAGDERAARIAKLIEDADMVEPNVAGELNAQIAYLQGYFAASDDTVSVTDAEILMQVSKLEPEIRDSTERWLSGFLFAAYAPLSDDELTEYTQFLTSREGALLWSALFRAFDVVLTQASEDLGRATAGLLQGETL